MRNFVLYVGLALLIAFEILRVYFIMPMPGSQEFDSIDLAYFLGSNKVLFRSIVLAIIAFPLYKSFRNGSLKIKIVLSIICMLYISIFYVFTFKMEADKMFYQPTKVVKTSVSKNKIPDNKLVANRNVSSSLDVTIKSAGKFLDRIYSEIDEDCMRYGYKDTKKNLYCDVSDRFNKNGGV
jgi:hypothetical protein